MNRHPIGQRLLLLLGSMVASAAWAGPTETYWHDDAGRSPNADAPHPAAFRALSLDTRGVAGYLKQAHERGIATSIALPQPDGGFADFLVVDSGTMPPELQHKYPDILSFKGTDGQGRPVRLDVSPLGFQAMVFDPAGIWVVRPETFAGGSGYLSFKRAELALPEGFGRCEAHGSGSDSSALNPAPAQPMTQTGINHRVYRTAVAANHQYIAAVGGGTVQGGLAATVVAVNRVTQVYETEMSIQLTLVQNNDLLMYASATGDPFTSNGGGVINNATTVINGVIGSANYDLGHVFTTGSGGVAGLGVVCGGSKARGTTGLPTPTGDAFYIDYVAHEMGHQFGANHPFNSTTSNCGGGNRNASTAYEPGSGSTIMAYAGICAADDLQPHSDPYFHAISLQEINNYTNGGGNCSANTLNDNQVPAIDTGSLPTGLTIPSRTPFVLSGSATDPDTVDTVTYSWEEWDLGPATTLAAGDNGSSPIFRAWPPTVSGARMFPRLSTVLTGTALKGETLPTTTRALKFRLTARDERPAYGTSQSADITVNVVNTAGPFQVTAPNTAVSWAQGSAQTVTWDVANTTAAPVSCSAVDIALSADGGQTFPYTLATGVANNGSAGVTIPNIATTKAGVSVACASNIFFDISNADFTIPAAAGTFTVGGTVSGLAGGGFELQLNGANDMPVAVNGTFAFPGALATGASYSVTVGASPAHPAQTCSVTNGSGNVGSANVTNVTVACTTTPATTYTIGGTVSGLAGTGLTLKLNGGTAFPISANGSYTFPTALADASVYTVMIASQPTGPAQACTLQNPNGTLTGANVTNVNVVCPSAVTYTIGGTVSGLTGTGLALSLNAGAQTLPVSANGSFTFPTAISDGSTYAVTVGTQPSAQVCSVTNGSGTVSGANVTNVSVSCGAAPTFTVGGTVGGLTGSGLVLSLNGGAQSLPVAASGSFTFPTGLANGAAYAVTVGTQPSATEQCVVANGSGTIAGANVTSVTVTCSIDDTIFADGFEAAATCAPLQLFQDPSFEATDGGTGTNPFWNSDDSISGSSLCDASCDDGGTVVARNGDWFVWFGGWDQANSSSLSQAVTFPAGQARWLNYWLLDQIDGDPTSSFTLSIDGSLVQTIAGGGDGSVYEAKTIEVPAQYLDGASHTVRFDWSAQSSGGEVGGAIVDDVTLDCSAQATRPVHAGVVRRGALRHAR